MPQAVVRCWLRVLLLFLIAFWMHERGWVQKGAWGVGAEGRPGKGAAGRSLMRPSGCVTAPAQFTP